MPRIRSSEEEIVETSRRRERRLQEAMDRLGTRNMNDTKWREVLDVLFDRRPTTKTVTVKFLDEERVFELTSVFPIAMPGVEASWVDGSCGPFQFRTIEWLEVQGADPAVREAIGQLGALPIEDLPGGFRLQAYGPLNPQGPGHYARE